MMSTPSIALSGMRAAQAGLRVSAHNVANLPTEGFRRQSVVSTAAADGGVTVDIVTAAEPAEALESDMVDQLQATNAFLANLQLFRTSDRMTGALLDALA